MVKKMKERRSKFKERSHTDRRSRENKRKKQNLLDSPDRRMGGERRKGERRCGEDRRGSGRSTNDGSKASGQPRTYRDSQPPYPYRGQRRRRTYRDA
jgi:hypothetical protein